VGVQNFTITLPASVALNVSATGAGLIEIAGNSDVYTISGASPGQRVYFDPGTVDPDQAVSCSYFVWSIRGGGRDPKRQTSATQWADGAHRHRPLHVHGLRRRGHHRWL
jgi:hypothetical protein